MKTGRYEACSLEYMEKIYIFGGQSNHSKLIENIEVYDPFENEWKIL